MGDNFGDNMSNGAQWTIETFMRRFEELLPLSKSYVEAYQKTEQEHQIHFGHARYKNYDSFRMTRKQHLEKK